jgi:hypothetical protein
MLLLRASLSFKDILWFFLPMTLSSLKLTVLAIYSSWSCNFIFDPDLFLARGFKVFDVLFRALNLLKLVLVPLLFLPLNCLPVKLSSLFIAFIANCSFLKAASLSF